MASPMAALLTKAWNEEMKGKTKQPKIVRVGSAIWEEFQTQSPMPEIKQNKSLPTTRMYLDPEAEPFSIKWEY